MPKFEFPSDKLDITNERAHTFIEKCEEYVDSMDEILSIFDDYKSLNSSFRLTLFFSAGGLINIANSYFVQINYTKYPCFLMFFCTGISYPLLIIPCMGYILNYLKQCYYSNYAYDKIANDESAISSNFSEPTKSTTEKVTTHKLLNKFNFYISAKFITKILFTYLAIIIIYSVIIGFISKDYSIFPLEQGFCTLTVEYAPQLFLIFFFFLIFLPFSVYELCKLNDSINMKTSLMFTTIFMFISLLGYFIMSLLPSYNCSQTSRYWPSDTFVLLLCISYHYTQIATPQKLKN
ncbi:hypothetical protein BCR32DRAFT_157413 [Anaeromyces robustus]|uniref:Uncharacterized protein n=1 Tax=Anaeromyces robustus TaxID=1754192 RepID=A0A1Y1XAZ8_9FUNG|nr:hypothetical protein BCR32DRAFT_157413 [Anaeromyces robustus]|eukprot:ORX82932.1 hypothetical protein BCR32DRAFT_157413 [Anaeromyces robustus]